MSWFLSKAAPIFWGSELAFLGCTVLARDPISSKANYLLRFLVLSLFINSHFLSQQWAHLDCLPLLWMTFPPCGPNPGSFSSNSLKASSFALWLPRLHFLLGSGTLAERMKMKCNTVLSCHPAQVELCFVCAVRMTDTLQLQRHLFKDGHDVSLCEVRGCETTHHTHTHTHTHTHRVIS